MDREKAEVYEIVGNIIANVLGRLILTVAFAGAFLFVLYVWSKHPEGQVTTVVAIFGMSVKPMAEFFFPAKGDAVKKPPELGPPTGQV